MDASAPGSRGAFPTRDLGCRLGGVAASRTDRFLYGCSALNLKCPLADVPLTSGYRRGRPSGMDVIRRGEDNVFMDVSYPPGVRQLC
jgi:hypothetical protein